MNRVLFLGASTLILLASIIYIFLFANHLAEPFELKFKDQMWQLRGVEPADPNIVIVDIDEASLQQIGQWPWPRNQVANLLYQLSAQGAAIIGMDVVFAEPDNASPAKILRDLELPNLAANLDLNQLDFDQQLATAIAQTPTILGYVFIQQPDDVEPGLVPTSSAIIIERNKPESSYLLKPYRAQLNLPQLQDAAFSSGFFNTLPDLDGVVRSVPLVMEYQQQLFPSLGLEMLRILYQQRRILVDYQQDGVETIQIGDLQIPTDPHGRMLINFRGPAKQYPYISAADVLQNKLEPGLVEDKIVLIGTSAAGLLDLRATPFDSVYPGVEVHANLLDNLLNQQLVAAPFWTLGANLVVLLAIGLLLLLALIWLGALASFLAAAVLLIGILIINYYLMIEQGLLLNNFLPVVLIIGLFIVGSVINFYFETKQKNFIKARFSQKVSPAVVEELIKSDTDLMLQGKEQVITVFFSDIRGFTSLSEAMKSPQKLIELLNLYMTPMVEIIDQHLGTVDKFIGDAIMAYWNAPIAVENHADQALTASIKQILALEKLNQQFKLNNWPEIKIGIGLNTGLAVVGEMGSIGRSDYTVIGDPINLGSRAESLTKIYAAKIIITEYTYNNLQDLNKYQIRYLDKVAVKGKTEPVKVYECYGFVDKNQAWLQLSEAEIELYNQAQQLYNQADFASALQLFEQLNQQNPQVLYQLFVERCQIYVANPPINFDGVFRMQTK